MFVFPKILFSVAKAKSKKCFTEHKHVLIVAASFFSPVNFFIHEFKKKGQAKTSQLVSSLSLCRTMLMTILSCFFACISNFLSPSMLISQSVNFSGKLSSYVLGKTKLLNSDSLLSHRFSSCSESKLLTVSSPSERETVSCPTLENWLFLDLFSYMELYS